MQTSFIKMHAPIVALLAHNTKVRIEQARKANLERIVEAAMQEKCVHRVPILGIKLFEHKRWPNEELVRRFHPVYQEAKMEGMGSLGVCNALKQMAEHVKDGEVNISVMEWRLLHHEFEQDAE